MSRVQHDLGVGDDPELRQPAGPTSPDQGYDVRCLTRNARQLMARLEFQRPDLLVLDPDAAR